MCDPGKSSCTPSKLLESPVRQTTESQFEVIDTSGSTMDISNTETTSRRKSFTNMFAAKKTVAQGMMDIALITANANQLRYLLEFSLQSKTFYAVFILIIISLILQIVVGIFLIFKGRYDLREEKTEHAVRMNNFIVLGVFIITIINVFISAFTITGANGLNLQPSKITN